MSSLNSNDYNPDNLFDDFIKVYGGTKEDVKIYSSPARINIIGEHIDYNGGKVFPAAIDRYLYVAIRKRTDTKIIYNDIKFPGTHEFDINDNFVFDKANDYANYLNGILSQLKERGYKFPCGFEILMVSNVPSAGGISSSSALECGFAYAVIQTFNFDIDRVEIAKLGQMSEHNFMNVNCGIMDQFIIANGKAGTATVLDCNTLEYSYAPLVLGDYRFVVMNTRKQRRLADSKYNERRSQCEQALKILQDNGCKAKALCEISVEEWESIKGYIKDDILLRRANHCIYENQRVMDSVKALERGDLVTLGKLLNESHRSLDQDYEVTGIELNTLAGAAQKHEACLGARMTGAGFGGCAIALVHKDSIEDFVEKVQKEYTETVGYEAGFFACESGDGVKLYK